MADPLFWSAGLLLALAFGMRSLAPVFAAAFPGVAPPVYARDGFPALLLQHVALVAVAAAVSGTVGLSLAILVTRPAGSAFRGMVLSMAVIGQAIPPVAILAVAVPAIGFGALPIVVALMIYGLLPIVENAVAGLDAVPATLREAASGIGLTPRQILREIELPLAAPAILAGFRLSVIVNIGTVAIGSTVGAHTLGMPIIAGLITNKPSYILQGAVVLALLAIVADLGFDRLGGHLRR
jgi:osmoprotectant transport system permease protein